MSLARVYGMGMQVILREIEVTEQEHGTQIHFIDPCTACGPQRPSSSVQWVGKHAMRMGGVWCQSHAEASRKNKKIPSVPSKPWLSAKRSVSLGSALRCAEHATSTRLRSVVHRPLETDPRGDDLGRTLRRPKGGEAVGISTNGPAFCCTPDLCLHTKSAPPRA